ncbi:unnamed protein product [Effrenium voratum]|nr:unnamed protein product [Effrenium voratum]
MVGRCLLLAGWDGEMLPVAVLPGCAGCGARQLLRAAKEVRPSLAAPLPPAESAQGVQAIHIEGTQLWALLSGHLQAWDLASPRSGRWVLHWPAEALPVASWPKQLASSIPVGICFTSCSEMEGRRSPVAGGPIAEAFAAAVKARAFLAAGFCRLAKPSAQRRAEASP